jgi:tRNA(Arg) A34 adenosine deaminase TadA
VDRRPSEVKKMDELDKKFLRASFEVARKARMEGNHPYGALLVDEMGQIVMESENTVVTDRDCTGHAETNLMRKASFKYDKEFLGKCTIYTSTEPCPMCAGAIFWANVKRVVYGLSEKSLYEMVGKESEEVLDLTCREIFGRGRKSMEVLGPLLEEEAREVHRDFWE